MKPRNEIKREAASAAQQALKANPDAERALAAPKDLRSPHALENAPAKQRRPGELTATLKRLAELAERDAMRLPVVDFQAIRDRRQAAAKRR